MKKTISQAAALLILLAGLAALPLAIGKGNDNIINLVILVYLYVMLASSWNILGGFTGQTNLGHAAFFGIGSLITRLLWTAGTPFPIAFVLGGIGAIALAMLIGVPAFKLRGVYFAIGTLALAQILNLTVSNIFPEMSFNPNITDYQLLPR